MTPRSGPLLAACLAALLAGCFATPQPAPVGPGSLRDVTEHDCVEQETGYVVPIARTQASGLYPPGFRAVAVDPAGQLTAVAYVGFACRSAELGGVRIGAHAWMGSFVLVEPPAALLKEGALHLLLLGVVMEEPRLRGVLQDWQVQGVEPGTVRLAFQASALGEDASLSAATAHGEVLIRSKTTSDTAQVEPLALRVFSYDPDQGRVAAVLDVDKGATLKRSGGALATFEGSLKGPLLPPEAGIAAVATHYGRTPFPIAFHWAVGQQ